MKKYISLILCLALATCLMGGCGMMSDDASSGTGEVSGSGSVTSEGNPYSSVVENDGRSGTVSYLGATLDIDDGEFIEDEDFDEHWFCLHLTYTNNLGSATSDIDDEDELDSLDRSFFIQAVQDGKVILPRSEEETETFEEDNAYEMINGGETRECEYYFPVDTSSPVTIQILDPGDEETVLAEYHYSPE